MQKVATVVGVISDTHGRLRPEALDALRDVSRILHAGDIGSPDLLAKLSALAPVMAIRGNIDTGQWAGDLPDTLSVEIESARVYLIHKLADLTIDPAAGGYHAVISGHSHRPSQSVRDGVLYLNPGSAGPRRFRLPVTLARLLIDGSKLHVEIVPLPERGEK
jgi:putative phosphoesterase